MTIPFYIGTYTAPESDSLGIYLAALDPVAGRLTAPRLVAEASRPGWLGWHPSRKWLYAAGEDEGGKAYAFAVNPDGGLAPLNDVTLPGDRGACHLAVCGGARAGQPAALVVVGYHDGFAASIPINPDGRLAPVASIRQHQGHGPHPTRQESAHPHSAYWRPDAPDAPTGQVLVADLGQDALMAYPFDVRDGRLADTPVRYAGPPGAGPRHLAFDPADESAWFVVNELDATVGIWRNGTLLQTVSSLPPEIVAERDGVTAAGIARHPNGRWLYVSNRGCDTLGRLEKEAASGRWRLVETVSSGGVQPRAFALSPDGRWLVAAHQSGNSLVLFRLDDEGRMHKADGPVPLGGPVCVLF